MRSIHSKQAAAQGHFPRERWHNGKGRSRFRANIPILALRRESGELEGGARVMRDVGTRGAAEEPTRPDGVRAINENPERSTGGVVSGEFDHVNEAKDAFLNMAGYRREDLAAGRLYWPDPTPPEYARLNELAHEEALRFGAFTLFEKEHVRKEGTCAVVATHAVLNLSPGAMAALPCTDVVAGHDAEAGHLPRRYRKPGEGGAGECPGWGDSHACTGIFPSLPGGLTGELAGARRCLVFGRVIAGTFSEGHPAACERIAKPWKGSDASHGVSTPGGGCCFMPVCYCRL
jgi:PAS domain-containing protein